MNRKRCTKMPNYKNDELETIKKLFAQKFPDGQTDNEINENQIKNLVSDRDNYVERENMTKDKDKLIPIEGGNRPNMAKEALRDILENWDHQVAVIQTFAKLHRVKYDALIEEGFNREEALELSKQVF